MTFFLLPDILFNGGVIMRYIYYIAIILLGLSAIIGYELRSPKNAEKDAALIINGNVLTTGEFNKLYSLQQTRMQSKADFINSLITKELLIQESQKEGIDKEESFRRSIQNFYEQSLIKLLIDRKLASLKVTVSDDEINTYLAALKKKFRITVFTFASQEQARNSKYPDGETRTVYLDDLSGNIRNSVLTLKEGQLTEPVKTGDTYTVIKLDRVELDSSRIPSGQEKEKIRTMLEEEKKEHIISDWITGLRKKATIKILVTESH
jgi:hypothetical protein